MFRALVFFTTLGFAIWGTLILTDLPGVVSLQWRGYQIDTTFAFLLGAVVTISFISALMYRFWLFLRRSPGNLADAWKTKRRQRGYQALTRGMVAVAAGDSIEAERQVKRADVLLDEPPLTMLVSAQSAQMKGDEAAAGKFFAAMVKRPETEFLGLRGLLNQAIKRGDKVEALSLVRRAHRLQPKSPWVASSMFDLQIRTGQWLDARVTCDELVRASLIDKDDAKRRKAVLSYQLSQLARDGGDAAGALSHLRDANTLAPGLISAVADLAGRWADAGKARKAVKLIEEAWSAVPHPALLQPYWRARNASDALERVRATEKLVQSQPLHLESLIALARASLDARLWGEARQDLEKALAATPAPQARIFRMMAELEETENAASDLAREWLMRASQATADPAWVCHHCGNTVADWSAICGKCEEFDSFDWRTPQSVLALAEPPRLETDVGDMVSLPPRGAEAG